MNSIVALPIVAAAPIAAPTLSAAELPDPMFAAVHAFEQADAAVTAAVYAVVEDEAATDAAYALRDAAEAELLRTRPTTPAGLAALTTWARGRMSWLKSSGSSLDGDNLYAISAAIDDATHGMSRLKPWSSIASPSIAAAAPAEDPIFAAIEKHEVLIAPYVAAWEARGMFDDCNVVDEEQKAELLRLNDECDRTHLPLEAAAEELINTKPTTMAGMATALRYFRTQHQRRGEFMVSGWWEDEKGERCIDWMDAFLDTLSDAAEAQLP